MMAGGEAALDAMLAAFGESVGYDGGGLAEPTDIMIIWSDVAGETFEGPSNTVREKSLEIRKGRLPEKPSRSDRITRDGVIWAPIDVIDRDDIDSWVVTLEQSA